MIAVAWCSNQECDHMDYFNTEKGEKPQKFCTQCGSPMVSVCPNCGSYRSDREDKFCPDCGKPYSPQT